MDKQITVATTLIDDLCRRRVSSAAHLHISIKTVEKHRQIVRHRTGASTFPDLVRMNVAASRPLDAVS